MLDARARSVVKPGIEVVAQLGGVGGDGGGEGVGDGDDDFSDGVDDAGERCWLGTLLLTVHFVVCCITLLHYSVLHYSVSHCLLYSLLHYLITL